MQGPEEPLFGERYKVEGKVAANMLDPVNAIDVTDPDI